MTYIDKLIEKVPEWIIVILFAYGLWIVIMLFILGWAYCIYVVID
jgi:hypothetical protein